MSHRHCKLCCKRLHPWNHSIFCSFNHAIAYLMQTLSPGY